MSKANYTWTPPKAKADDTVNFLDHRGQVRFGTVTFVATHYGYHDHVAYHIYSVLIEGRKRCLNVGDKNIINVVK